MPARCPKCGSFVKKDAESCPRCGADLSAIPLTEPKETQTSGQAATHSSPNKKTKQDKTAEPTKKTRADKTTGTSGNTRKNKTVKSIKKTRTDKTAKTSKKAVQKESVEQPREEADSPYQDTEKYPRLVQEFTAYYNKYQQLRQKAMQQPQKFDKQLKRYLKIRHATPTPPDTPWLGRFRIYRDYRCVFRVSFKKECILVEWPSQKKNLPDHSDEREPDTDAQTLLRLLCSDLHVSDYEESQLSYTSDARINDLLSTDTDSEIFLSSLILSITATAIIALAWHHGKLGLGAAYFLSLGFYILLPPIVHLFQADPTHPDTTGGNT